MTIFKILHLLYRLQLLSPRSWLYCAQAIYKSGINMMVLLRFASKRYGSTTAIIDDEQTISYEDLATSAEQLAYHLQQTSSIGRGSKVAIISRNHIQLVEAIFACAQLGVDTYLLHVDTTAQQWLKMSQSLSFDLVITDASKGQMFQSNMEIDGGVANEQPLFVFTDELKVIIEQQRLVKVKLKRTYGSKLVVLSGGTTGAAKSIVHQPSMISYLYPAYSFITKLQLLKMKRCYIATPIFHGYGLAMLMLLLFAGKTILLRQKFHAVNACRLIEQKDVDMISVVPTMLLKIWEQDAKSLSNVQCIASGGAPLPAALVGKIQQKFADVLYNLYGTSESGTVLIATPQHLHRHADTVGKPIYGAKIRILDSEQQELPTNSIGELYIKSKWSKKEGRSKWLPTGDLGYRDEEGYYYLCGRLDDRIVSGGENVYPSDLEQQLFTHPNVAEVAVIGVADDIFGQRLRAYVKLTADIAMTEAELMQWLRDRVARYQLPREIMFVEQLPYTSLGKVDKQRLGIL